MVTFAADPDEKLTDDLLTHSKGLYALYNDYLKQIRQGNFGKAAQYWLTYLDIMRMQHVIHTAVQENTSEAQLYAWEYFIPFYFVFNKTNYVRYGSYYLETLKAIENSYPGMKEMTKQAGLSVQGQDKYPLRKLIDQLGEQTMNRDAKTTGGIKAFTTNEESILKWSLTCSFRPSTSHKMTSKPMWFEHESWNL